MVGRSLDDHPTIIRSRRMTIGASRSSVVQGSRRSGANAPAASTLRRRHPGPSRRSALSRSGRQFRAELVNRSPSGNDDDDNDGDQHHHNHDVRALTTDTSMYLNVSVYRGNLSTTDGWVQTDEWHADRPDTQTHTYIYIHTHTTQQHTHLHTETHRRRETVGRSGLKLAACW